MNCHESLENYYKVTFQLMYNLGEKNLNPLEWEDRLLPFERTIYIDLITAQLEADNKSKSPEIGE